MLTISTKEMPGDLDGDLSKFLLGVRKKGLKSGLSRVINGP
jgi:hypothetical protein